ncbi:ubiquitin carboxyl-terminal hydrolase 12, partial [Tanacetum coccineum]
ALLCTTYKYTGNICSSDYFLCGDLLLNVESNKHFKDRSEGSSPLLWHRLSSIPLIPDPVKGKVYLDDDAFDICDGNVLINFSEYFAKRPNGGSGYSKFKVYWFIAAEYMVDTIMQHQTYLIRSMWKRFKFDDERVTKEDMKRALEEQYGGEEELSQTNPGYNNAPFKFRKYSNAYMLVYICQSDKEKIVCDVAEKDIAEHLRKEQEEKEDKRKYKAQAHLFTIIKVIDTVV